jgi:ribose-phosphate pyrophosphokinase
MRLFALSGSTGLGGALAAALGRALDPHEERDFEDGEHKSRPMTSVRGRDVYVLAALAAGEGASPNDRLVKLLFFLAACRDDGAARVSAVLPYLAYARKDRQTKRRDPVATRTTARLIEAAGADRVIALDVHDLAAFQNAYRCPTVHLTARPLFVPRIQALAAGRPVTVFSPDAGGVKRAELLRAAFEAGTGAAAGFGFMEKHRSRGVVTGALFAGEVDGRAVFLVDDMIATGGTLLRAARACRERGAAAVHGLATHALLGPGSAALLADPALDGLIVTDSLPGPAAPRLERLPLAPLLAGAIARLHDGRPLDDLTGLED